MFLNKDSLNKVERKSSVVELGDDLQVKIVVMSLSQQLELENNKDKDNDFVIYMLKNCCVDEQNAPLFDDVDQVKALPADISIKLFHACVKLNNLAQKELENIAKNS